MAFLIEVETRTFIGVNNDAVAIVANLNESEGDNNCIDEPIRLEWQVIVNQRWSFFPFLFGKWFVREMGPFFIANIDL